MTAPDNAHDDGYDGPAELVTDEGSVAVQVTLVVPSGKAAPVGGTQTTDGVPQLSVAAGVA